MDQSSINRDYFEWMLDVVCRDRFAKNISYRKLLERLHDIEFTWSIPKDFNRASDGIALRRRFAFYCCMDAFTDDISEYINGPCSVLEMIVALAIRCETDIMQDPSIGDRTAQWFWRMIVSLGLGDMNDGRYDEKRVLDIIDTFLDREYEPDGHGGLFTIRHCAYDLRDIEIWVQMLWYIGTIS